MSSGPTAEPVSDLLNGVSHSTAPRKRKRDVVPSEVSDNASIMTSEHKGKTTSKKAKSKSKSWKKSKTHDKQSSREKTLTKGAGNHELSESKSDGQSTLCATQEQEHTAKSRTARAHGPRNQTL
ncbi:hypothetical protein OBBRIDRAFT_834125 [Obba rivulosa]|uniref:Uncharacterized protein n=1 Tax=Obba rivulosa TaxID=1052685 RepID=A0A8E2DM13_9APHY|nr:hypothetical protein OBBRIDRAFT_834125 [Obba rivulosa]